MCEWASSLYSVHNKLNNTTWLNFSVDQPSSMEKNKMTVTFFFFSFFLTCEPFFYVNYSILFYLSLFFLLISHDLQKRVVDKEQEKQKILDNTTELTEKNAKISQEMEKMNQELKNVEK